MNIHDFVAVDFETATASQMICQVGIVVVKDDVITEKFESLVKPPQNKYDHFNSIKNHIKAEDTNNSPTFEELWPEIEKYFVNRKVVCHNKGADFTYLKKNLEAYNIMMFGINEFDDTCDYYNKCSLESLCAGFNIEYNENEHHSALYDATCCAEFAIHMYKGEQPDWDKVDEVYIKNGKKRKTPAEKTKYHKKLQGDILVKDLSKADPNNPFYDRKVVITGTFNIERSVLAKRIKSMGADIDTSISKKTNFVCIGDEPGPAKIEKLEKLIHDGYNIKKLYWEDLENILSEEYEPYMVDAIVKKDLNLTIDHYNKHHLIFENGRNIISLKNLYYGKGMAGSIELFCIITGNLGATGDFFLDKDTDICVLSDSTIEKLKRGEKDSTIEYIQDYYNNNKSITFELTFISENDILEFCRERCEKCGDMLTLGYYNKYINSKI